MAASAWHGSEFVNKDYHENIVKINYAYELLVCAPHDVGLCSAVCRTEVAAGKTK